MKLIYKLIIFFILINSLIAYATDIRGRIDIIKHGYHQPLPRAEVSLLHNGNLLENAFTGRDGFYYFYNIKPGNYILEINRAQRIQISIPKTQGYDVQPILVE